MATTAVLAPPPFDAEAVARQLRDDGITIVSLVPDAARSGCSTRAPTPGPALRRVLLGGGPMPPRAARARPRRRLPGLPELRAHAGVLDGHRRRARRPRDRRARRCPASASRSPTTARSSSPARTGQRAAAACAPATSAASTSGAASIVTGPQGRHDHHRRRERRAGRGRGRAGSSTPASPRRPSSPARTRSGARRSPPGGRRAGRRARRQATLRAHCLERLARLQGPEGVRARGRAAAHRVGQGAPHRAALACRRAWPVPDDFRSAEPQALGRAGGGLGGAARRAAHRHDARLGLDDRRDRPAAGPDAARARRRARATPGLLAAELIAARRRADHARTSPPRCSRRARRRAEELGVAQRALQADRRRDEHRRRGGELDGVLCRWGYMLMADPGARCARRAACSGPAGALALAAWAGAGGQPVERAARRASWSSAAWSSRRDPTRPASSPGRARA